MTIKKICVFFIVAIVIQALHMVEHVAQVIQKFWLKKPEAHGLLGVLDFEWVHFVYNLSLLLSLCALLFWWRILFKDKKPAYRTSFYLLAGATVWQGYHMLEHTVKIVQFMKTGLHGTPGILGNVGLIKKIVPGPWLHFYFNLAVLFLMTFSFLLLKKSVFRGSLGGFTRGMAQYRQRLKTASPALIILSAAIGASASLVASFSFRQIPAVAPRQANNFPNVFDISSDTIDLTKLSRPTYVSLVDEKTALVETSTNNTERQEILTRLSKIRNKEGYHGSFKPNDFKAALALIENYKLSVLDERVSDFEKARTIIELINFNGFWLDKRLMEATFRGEPFSQLLNSDGDLLVGMRNLAKMSYDFHPTAIMSFRIALWYGGILEKTGDTLPVDQKQQYIRDLMSWTKTGEAIFESDLLGRPSTARGELYNLNARARQAIAHHGYGDYGRVEQLFKNGLTAITPEDNEYTYGVGLSIRIFYAHMLKKTYGGERSEDVRALLDYVANPTPYKTPLPTHSFLRFIAQDNYNFISRKDLVALIETSEKFKNFIAAMNIGV